MKKGFFKRLAPKQILKSGQQLQFTSTRTIKVFEGNTNHKKGDLVYIEPQDTLIFMYNTQEELVFKAVCKGTKPSKAYCSNETKVCIDKTIFDIKNYRLL